MFSIAGIELTGCAAVVGVLSNVHDADAAEPLSVAVDEERIVRVKHLLGSWSPLELARPVMKLLENDDKTHSKGK